MSLPLPLIAKGSGWRLVAKIARSECGTCGGSRQYSSIPKAAGSFKFLRSAGNVHRTYDNGAPGYNAASYPMIPN